MKKLILSFLALVLCVTTYAQVETSQPSPFSKVEQKVGVTDVIVKYSRPGVKGRTIFGDLVPFGEIWRTGANKNTVITFGDDVVFDGQSVKSGSYALYTDIVDAKHWVVYLYSDASNWGTPEKWDDSKIVAKAKVEVMPLPFNVETFTIGFGNISNDRAELELSWEKSYVTIPFEVPTNAKVEKNIKKTFADKSYTPTAEDYYKAAVHYLDSHHPDKHSPAKWIDKAVEMTKERPRFWYIHQQALIHFAAGNRTNAVKAAKRSMELAKEAKYDQYVEKNKDFLTRIGEL